jgi:hypothetical protein
VAVLWSVVERAHSSVSGTLLGTTQISSEENLDAEAKENKRKRRNEQDKESTVVSYYYFIKQFLIEGGNQESHTKQSYLNKSCTTIY